MPTPPQDWNPPPAAGSGQARNEAGDGDRGQPETRNGTHRLLLAAIAAFCTYFCMYAFRKPFTAATFEQQEAFGFGLKSTLIISQLAGYMLSKFIGIKVISELSPARRAVSIIGLILFAEAALLGFAVAPVALKIPMMFLNGLPLGMIFGIVLSYLEGRRHTEALSAALCASFIISSGVVKSIGRWLIQDQAISEFWMPAIVGLMFLPPLLISVWLLERTPPPDSSDKQLRRERAQMNGADRRRFWNAYWPGLSALVLVYVALTIVRTIRDDFAVEIWRDMGIDETPSVFARSEMVVAIFVTALNAFAIWIRHNLAAIRATIYMMCTAFALIAAAAVLQSGGHLSAFTFMVACGVGMYIPYVAYHTTLFERLVAASKHSGNLVFLMYVADAMGYLGYAFVLTLPSIVDPAAAVLPMFRNLIYIVATLSIAALVVAWVYFRRVLVAEPLTETSSAEASSAEAMPFPDPAIANRS
jgi:hypothetical protein